MKIGSIKMARYTNEQIVARLIKVHGNEFDYSLVKYVNATQNVKLICKTHGLFEQLVSNHIRRQGCPQCAHERRKFKQSEVIDGFKAAHGDRYDYSLVEYVRIDRKVKIICREHGIFEQLPHLHRSGANCAKCAGIGQLTQEEVVAQFIAVHGNKYDYSQLIYIRDDKKVKIICPEHGLFEQTPTNHKSGRGCLKCSGKLKLTTEQIIQDFKKVHGSKYDYSLVEYTRIKEKVKIICPEHGVFEQTPANHRGGQNCPDCALLPGHHRASYIQTCQKYQGQCYLYIIKCTGSDECFYKVGITARGTNKRFESHRKLPYSFEILKEIRDEAGYIWDLEKQINRMLKQYRYLPNLHFGGSAKECFTEIPKSVLKLLDEIDSQQMQLIA